MDTKSPEDLMTPGGDGENDVPRGGGDGTPESKEPIEIPSVISGTVNVEGNGSEQKGLPQTPGVHSDMPSPRTPFPGNENAGPDRSRSPERRPYMTTMINELGKINSTLKDLATIDADEGQEIKEMHEKLYGLIESFSIAVKGNSDGINYQAGQVHRIGDTLKAGLKDLNWHLSTSSRNLSVGGAILQMGTHLAKLEDISTKLLTKQEEQNESFGKLLEGQQKMLVLLANQLEVLVKGPPAAKAAPKSSDAGSAPMAPMSFLHLLHKEMYQDWQ